MRSGSHGAPNASSPAALVRAATERLARAGVTAPRADAEQLLAYVLDVPRGQLVLAARPDDEQRRRYEALLARRADREPLQHLTGRVGFRTVELAVGPGVFVPRPETELLTGWAVDEANRVVAAGRARPVVVDLCAGSGAIAVAVAAEVGGAQVHAVELDPAAHAYAERNIHGTGAELRLGDAAVAFADLDGEVDVVVANPPYIPLEAYEGVDLEVRRHDPPVALWSGEDGLDAIRMVERVAARLLRPGGAVGCEHADVQGRSAPAVFSGAERWAQVRDHCDLVDRPRFVTARRWHSADYGG